MTTPPTSTASTEDRQHLYLKQLFEHQLAMKQLLDQQPRADKVLADLLLAKIQRSFPGHPLPIALEDVSYQEDIQLSTGSGTHALIPTDAPTRPLSALFTDNPWGGESLDAPSLIYRFHAKFSTSINPAHRSSGSIGSTPAFETFIDELIRHPDRLFAQQLDSFWQAPFSDDESMTRRLWLADRHAQTLQAEAALRVEDGTLDEPFKRLIDQIVRWPTSQARAHLSAGLRPSTFTLSLKGQNNKPDIALTGVFLLASKTPDAAVHASSDIGPVALFTPDRGIDSFASLQALDEALHARLSGGDAGGGLLINITWQDQARARRSRKKLAAFIYTPVADNLFENRVDALLALQKQDIGHGWRLFPRHEVDGQQVHELFDRLADISSFLDIRGVLVERSRRYIEANMPSWYQQAPARDQHPFQHLADAV